MSLETITQILKQKVAMAPHIKAKAKFNFGDDGVIFIDSTQTPAEITHEDQDADIELITSIDTFQGIMDGTQDPNIAFMLGKLKVKGNMGLAMKLNAMLED